MIEQQFVEYVVKKLVDNPDAVVVTRTEDNRGVLLELTVDPDDLGRVIGRHGATAQSLRNILRALAVKNGTRYNLKIVDTDRDNGVATTDNAETVDTVEKNDTEAVENTSSRADKLREDLADLSDFDI
ncbi:MAG: KH domain-containing protein [Candidatus Saccharibacteria bacterium]|nr:KH domain-containing protein [Candidatus Saccharibacteria bacterium]